MVQLIVRKLVAAAGLERAISFSPLQQGLLTADTLRCPGDWNERSQFHPCNSGNTEMYGGQNPPYKIDQAAIGEVGISGLEISATVFDTFSGLSFKAKSACETIPMQQPCPSTTGIRRI